MQQEILLADGVKHIAMNGKFGAFPGLGHLQLQAVEAGKGLVPQLLMTFDGSGQLLQKSQVNGAMDAVDHGLRHLQGLDEMVSQFLVHGAFHFQPHDRAMLTFPELGLHRPQ